MRGAVAVMLAAVLGGWTAGSAQATDAPAILHDSLEEATSRDTYLLVAVCTDWCPYCAAFRSDCETESALADALSPLVFQEVDGESEGGREVRAVYWSAGYPTFLLIDSGGELKGWFSGYGDVASFCSELDTLVARARQSDAVPPPEPNRPLAYVAPNPFNPTTTLHVYLRRAGMVAVEVVDLRGRRVSSLRVGPLPAGPREIAWSGLDEDGQRLSSGTYLLRVRTPEASHLTRATLLR